MIPEARSIHKMKFVIISNPVNVNNEHVVVCELFRAGLLCFHLRKPEFDLNEMREYLKKIPKEFHERIVLHSHFELSKEYNLKGIHSSSVSGAISRSFHSLDEIKNHSGKLEYAFLSPVFDSISKVGYKAAFQEEEVVEFLKTGTHDFDLIALGGIDEKTISVAHEYGFDGGAVLGALWMSADPLSKFKQLQFQCTEFSKLKNTQHV